MKFERTALFDMPRCYAVQDVAVDGTHYALYATEGQGPCRAVRLTDFTAQTVWEQPGGTMCMVPIPGKNGDFLAVQHFYPTFDAKESDVVWVQPQADGSWKVRKLFTLPYLHRFDILSAGGVHYFFGATLCTSKAHKQDWSDPGKLYAGVLPENLSQPIELTVLAEGMVKNHGYCRAAVDGAMCGLTTCESGVYLSRPPSQPGGAWAVTQLMTQPTSDIEVVDIDGDGEDELVTIEGFHGGNFLIYKKIQGAYQVVYRYPKRMDFAHAIWSDSLCGRPVILGGHRRHGKELFAVTCTDPHRLVFHTQTIDRGEGPSNVHVAHTPQGDFILCSGRETGTALLYRVLE